MARKVIYTPELTAEILGFFKDHTLSKTAAKFNIPPHTVNYLAQRNKFSKGCDKYSLSFKHNACQYYEHHTGVETLAKFKITIKSLSNWRKDLGYRNKHRGYNLYTEVTAPKAVRKNYRIVKAENGDLKAQMMNLQGQVEDLKEQNRAQSQRIESFVQAIGGLLQQ